MASRRHESVCGKDACSTAIGQDREPLSHLLMRQRQRLHGIEQFGHSPDPQHPGAAKRGVVDSIGAGKGAGMRGGSARTRVRAACFQHQDGLDPRGCARRRHELAAMRDALDIKQDGAGVRIRSEIVENVAKIDIRRISQ